MIDLRQVMPLAGRLEGVWEGTHQLFDAAGRKLDQHRVRNVGRVLDDADAQWHQTNTSFWDDGRSRRIDHRASYRDGRLWFDNEWASGWVREIEADLRAASMLVYWQWKAPDAWVGRPTRDLHMYQWMQISPDGQHRHAVVQWLDDGVLVQRSLNDETLLTRDWRGYENELTTAGR